MNEYVWETCEELDKKIADRVRLIRKDAPFHKRSFLRLAMSVLAR